MKATTKTVELTKKEIKALLILISDGNACASGCVSYIKHSQKNGCNECEYTKNIHSIEEKLR